MAMDSHIRMKYTKHLLLFITLHVFLSSCVALSGIYYDNGVDKTVVDKHLTRREKTEMEQEILDLLGLHHRPRPMLLKTKKGKTENENALNSAPRFLMDVYQSLTEEDSGELKLQPDLIEREFNVTRDDVTAMEEADIIMSFINHGRFFDGIGNFHGDGRFWFDMSEVPSSAAVMSAELRLYISRNEIEQNDNSFLDDDDNDTVSIMDSAQSAMEEGFTLTLYQIFQGRTEGDLVYVDSIETEINQEGWVALNVSSSLKHWLEKPGENLGLQLVCRTLSGRQVSSVRAGVVGSHGEDKLQPFMVAFFRSVPQHKTVSASEAANARESDEENLSTLKSRRRIRRQTSNKKRSNKDTSNTDEQTAWNPYSGFDARYAKRSCQKKNLYVSFRDLEWQDWIIAPDGYAAFYCNGECSFPLNAHMNASNHAIVQTLVHLMNPYRVPKPCCAPIKLSPISVLYFDDTSNVILKKFRNMVVKSCGCH